jgi:hypothetical protein
MAITTIGSQESRTSASSLSVAASEVGIVVAPQEEMNVFDVRRQHGRKLLLDYWANRSDFRLRDEEIHP